MRQRPRHRVLLQGIDAAPCVPQASVDFRCHLHFLFEIRALVIACMTLCSNLWGVFKDWWRHHGPLFSLSGENAFYQLWQQAVPRVTIVRAARAWHADDAFTLCAGGR